MARPPVRELDTRASEFEAEFAVLENRRRTERAELEESVAAIVTDVRRQGDAAVLTAIERFDGYRLEASELVLSREEIDAGVAALDAEDAAALDLAAERVRTFHSYRVTESWSEREGGDRLGQLVRPLRRVAMYAPGGNAPLASTVLMLGIPASVAGVPDLVLSSPGRSLAPAMLAAARLAGVGRLYRMGGAQAVAALAYGTETVERVDKIVGPGNAYVQEAKRQVFGEVAIDSEAGPSEVFIVAEPDSSPVLLAADLLAQAEHDAISGSVLATPSEALAAATLAELSSQLSDLPTAEIARKALEWGGAVIVTRDLEEALELANRYAPEHLQLFARDPDRWLDRVENAGAIFLGPYSPVSLGDYVAGPSHVLPTAGTARFFSVLGVEDFQKRTSLIEFSERGFQRLAPAAARLARLEGLFAHSRALEARKPEGVDPGE
ncbi:MAG: histidinol dehydrogenase [Myxococcota bacterium]